MELYLFLLIINFNIYLSLAFHVAVNFRSKNTDRFYIKRTIGSSEHTLQNNLKNVERIPSNSTTLIRDDVFNMELNSVLNKMTSAEKYEILLQSCSNKILESTEKNISQLSMMSSLFNEMLQNSISPTDESAKLLIDASSNFRSCEKLGTALQLSKAGGVVKAFGVSIGRLLTPIVNSQNSDFLPAFPSDNREKEVIYASIVGVTAFSWLSLQALSIFDSDLHSWGTILASIALSIGLADIVARSAVNTKTAIAGFDRLLLKDKEREVHSDSAAFLLGYLLGLPCFCFRSDVTEALKMVLDNRKSMEVFRQPIATSLRQRGAAMTTTSTSTSTSSTSSFNAFQWPGSKSNPSGTSTTSTTSANSNSLSNRVLLIDPLPSTIDVESDLLGVGRVLIWLLAPVAAESLKYGKSVISDPRRCIAFLSVLDEIIILQNKEKFEVDNNINKESPPAATQKYSTTSKSSVSIPTIPPAGPDRDAFMRWAYFEAETLVKQYGDLLELLRGYMMTGTTSVGECVMLLEKELRA